MWWWLLLVVANGVLAQQNYNPHEDCRKCHFVFPECTKYGFKDAIDRWEVKFFFNCMFKPHKGYRLSAFQQWSQAIGVPLPQDLRSLVEGPIGNSPNWTRYQCFEKALSYPQCVRCGAAYREEALILQNWANYCWKLAYIEEWRQWKRKGNKG